MRALLINGSPRKEGNTCTALKEIAAQLAKNGVDSEIVWIGNKYVRGCIACGQCKAQGNGQCAFGDDVCNEIIAKMNEADALVVGSPVYYGTPTGNVLNLLHRMMFVGAKVEGKPAAKRRKSKKGGPYN